ncbi:hypothetical protein ACA910_006769 [Epithemia clementina (nom. ined.)]
MAVLFTAQWTETIPLARAWIVVPLRATRRLTSIIAPPHTTAHRRSSFLSEPLVARQGRYLPHRSPSSSSSSLSMMFDQLSAAISSVAQNLASSKSSKMTEQSIKPALRQVRRALLEADVNVEVADTLLEGVKKRSLGQAVIQGVSAEQQFVKAMYDELLDLMGGDSSSTTTSSSKSTSLPKGTSIPAAQLVTGTPANPAVILLAGLQGAGKTTAAGKLALFLSQREVDYEKAAAEQGDSEELLLPSRMPKRQRKVLLVAADVYRPAAIEQLQVLGQRINVPVYTEDITKVKDPVIIVKNALTKAKKEQLYDTIIVDTAGRQVVDDNLMNELKRMKQVSQADETLLIVDAMTGQEAATLTAAFDQAVGVTGAILTKLDGDSRGGAAVSVRAVSGQPIKFVGTGEKLEDLEPFYPDRMASRILGMGDVVSLVEKASAQVSEAEALKLQEKMKEATFDFEDFMKQSELISKMGSVAGLAKLMPGMGGQLSNAKIREVEERLKKSKALINSMTRKERNNPDLLIKDSTARSRLIRITKGSGLKLQEGQQFMSEFQRMRTMMARMSKVMDPGGAANGLSAGASDEDLMGAAMAGGNRSMRRAAKKNKKGRAGGGGGGFGK